jgi:hypothetical protein
MNPVEEISETLDRVLKPIFSDKTTAALVTLFLVLYGGLAAPKLPKSIAQLFKNPIFKMIILSLIAYTASKNASVAIIAAVALVISIQTLSKYDRSDKVIQELEEKAEGSTEEASVADESVSDEATTKAPLAESETVVPLINQEANTTGVQPVEEEKYAPYQAQEVSQASVGVESEASATDSEDALNTSEEDVLVKAHAQQELAAEVSSESEVQPLATNVQPMASGLADVVQPMASELAETAQPIGSELKEVAQTIVPEAVSEETPPGVDIPGRQIENNDGYPKRSISIENCQRVDINEHLENVTGFDSNDNYASY